MKRIISMLLFSLLFGNAATVSPCSCAGYTERETFRKADYVFLGQVVEIADSGQDYFVYAVKFKVEKQWKGARKAERNLQIEDAAGSMKKLNQPIYRFLARLYRF
jgi:hypothetical protein